MIIQVKIEESGELLDVEIGLKHSRIAASHSQQISLEQLPGAVGTVVERIFNRRRLSMVEVPDGMKMVDVGISWLAFSEVCVAVPIETPDDGDALRNAVGEAIKRDGLPEVVDNPTLSFLTPLTAYAPRKSDGFFDMSTEHEIELEG